jgi:hypothetical protein|tara:strand:- start:74 stop:808 length:735 start_codon:yes stop_codon:yes gene_type:complete
MLFFKKPTVTLDCFTYDDMIAKTASISPAIKFYPKWMKDMHPVVSESKYNANTQETHTIPSGTVRGCPGIVDYFKTGVIAPLWVDASVIVNSDGRYSYHSADQPFSIESHFPGQWAGYKGYTHMKFVLPWHIEESTGVQFLLQRPMWTDNTNPLFINKLTSAGGVIDFKSQHSLHLHTFLEIPNEKQEFMLPFGLPLLHMIPLTDKTIKIKTHVISEEEWKKKTTNSTGAKTYLKPSKTRDINL